MASESETGVSGVAKWKIAAAALAAGGAVGLGIWYYKRRSRRGDRAAAAAAAAAGSKAAAAAANGSEPVATVVRDPPTVVVSGAGEPSSASTVAAGGGQVNSAKSPLDAATEAKEKGNKFYRGGKYDKAIECYTEAISQWPKEGADSKVLSTFYQNRAAAYEQLKNHKAVIADCTAALQYDTKYQKALARRAKAAEALEDYRSALQDATAASILDGFKSADIIKVAEKALRQISSQKAKEYYATREPLLPSNYNVKSYFTGFCCDPVIGNIDELLKKENRPEHPFLQAIEDFSSGSYANVVALCTAELESTGDDGEYALESRLLRGTFFILMGNGAAAINDLTQIVESSRATKELKSCALVRRASVHLQTFDEGSAQSDMAKAVAVHADSPDVYYHRGLIYMLTENVDGAMKDFQTCINIKPDFATAHVQKCCTEYRLAMMLQSLTQMQIVLKSFEELCSDFPNCCDALVSYGQVLLENQQFEPAKKMFEKAMKLEPDNATILVHRGMLFQQWKGDSKAFEQDLKEALRLDEKCEAAYETLGTLEIQRGDLSLGIEYFRKALPLVKSEAELAHLFSLIEASTTQISVAQSLGTPLPNGFVPSGVDATMA